MTQTRGTRPWWPTAQARQLCRQTPHFPKTLGEFVANLPDSQAQQWRDYLRQLEGAV